MSKYKLVTAQDANDLVNAISQLAMDIIAGEISHIEEPAMRFLISNRVAGFIFQANFKINNEFAEDKMIALKERIELSRTSKND